MGNKPVSAELKHSAVSVVDAEYPHLRELALRIHANPELGFKEVQASSWLSQYLEENGFSVERGICGMPTAFKAKYGRDEPNIAILAEYDALPGIGHACGHNLIGTIAVGAAVAAKRAVDRCGGCVMVIGTPAEEGFGGKDIMAKQGAFNGLDAAMIVHPDTVNEASTIALACQNLYIEFFGKSSHAAASPEKGINALDAMILSFNGINALRQHIKSSARIHGIITSGGEAANIVPSYTAGTFIVRATEDSYLDELEQKVLNCFIGAANSTGARLEYKWDKVRYAAMRTNTVLAQLYSGNMALVGRKVSFPEPDAGSGSTDMGNVSQLTPAIHPTVAIAPEGMSLHSSDFAVAAASEAGLQGMRDAAKAVAMMVVDLLSNPETLHKVKEEFEQTK